MICFVVEVIMPTLKFLVLCSLFYCVKTEGDNGLGYLSKNISSSPFTVLDKSCSAANAATVKMCSVHYMVEPKFVALSLRLINLTLNSLNFDKGVNVSCRESVRAYMCSKNIPICDDKNGSLIFNTKKTKRACANVTTNCPAMVKEHIINNCTITNQDHLPLARCVPLPNTNGICPTRNYKIPQFTAKIYKTVVNGFKMTLNLIKGSPLLTNSCKEKLRNLMCYVSGGPACSDDGKLLVHAISRQDCERVVKTCVENPLLNLEQYCNPLPNTTNAQRVPLPPGLTAEAILAEDKTKPSPSTPATKTSGGNTSYLSASYLVPFLCVFLIVNKLFVGFA